MFFDINYEHNDFKLLVQEKLYSRLELEIVLFSGKREEACFMEIAFLSLEQLKTKWMNGDKALNPISVGGNLFSLPYFVGTSLLVKDSTTLSQNHLHQLLEDYLNNRKFNNKQELRLFLYPLIRYVLMDNVGESHHVFYTHGIDHLNAKSLKLDWEIVKVTQGSLSSEGEVEYNSVKEINNIANDQVVSLLIEVIILGEQYYLECILVGIDYFFSKVEERFEIGGTSIISTTPFHVVTDYTENNLMGCLEHVFDNIGGNSIEELLLKLSAYFKVHDFDIEKLYKEKSSGFSLRNIEAL